MGKTWVKFSSGVGKTAKAADKPYRLPLTAYRLPLTAYRLPLTA
ncbi:MAG: hypothetical protein ABF751_12575 [Acetobacter orientalis]